MKKRILLLVLTVLLLLSACGNPAPVTEAPTEPTETTAPAETTQVPQLPETFAETMTYEELGSVSLPEITPENRCAMTTLGAFAETEERYYQYRQVMYDSTIYNYIYYAEKSDSTTWLPLCTREGCLHRGEEECLANDSGIFWLTEDGLYLDNFEKLALDGSSREPWDPNLQLGYSPVAYTPNAHVTMYAERDGSGDRYVIRQMDGEGTKTLFRSQPYPRDGWFPYGFFNEYQSVRGDALLRGKMPMDGSWDETPGELDQRAEDEYVSHVHGGKLLSLENHREHPYYGAYLYGNHYYHYHENDGFYYMDLTTGTETKIADAAYENAFGYCLDGNLLVESSMKASLQSREPAEAGLRYCYEGQWYALDLPGDWQGQHYFNILAATSDRIFFEISDSRITQPDHDQWQARLYYVLLGDTTPVLCDSYPCF